MLRLHNWISQHDKKSSMDDWVFHFQRWLKGLQDQDIIELLMTGFIPDDYEENREKEKVYTKLIEVLISECFDRIGFSTVLRKTKSECEDIQLLHNKKAILTDAKTFRLGRSQVAPNVKDFVKLSTIEKWINHYNEMNKATAIGGLVVYPSTHEWKKQSEVYKECSNKSLPIVMLPFEILSYFLQEKNSFTPEQLFSLWNYQTIFPSTVKARSEYWSSLMPIVAMIVGKSIQEVEDELAVFQLYYTEAVHEARIDLHEKINRTSNLIPQKVEQMSEQEVRSTLESLLLQVETSKLNHSLQNINKHRKQYVSIA